MMGKNPGSNTRGVTLIELVMVIVVAGILAGSSSMFIKETIDLWRFLSFRSEVVSQERMALMRMGRETRQIKNKASIAAAEVARFGFHDSNENDIEYQFASGNLTRKSGVNPTDILVSNVSSLTFTYYDVNSQVLVNPTLTPETNIRRILITLTVGAGLQSKTLKMQVYPRNFS